MTELPESEPLTPDPKLEAGAEPYWMQDVRLAQRRIEAQRAEAARLRAAAESSSSES